MNDSVLHPLAQLQHRLERTRRLAVFALLVAAAALAAPWVLPPRTANELRVRSIEVVDQNGIVRLRLGEDGDDIERRSTAAGLFVFDGTGHERGGFGTMADGSVVMALDAPAGVGSPMPDRIGMLVRPDGSSLLLVNDNGGNEAVTLFADPTGAGLQTFRHDGAAKQVRIKTLSFDGEAVRSEAMPH
jgi:hypothetical protein